MSLQTWKKEFYPKDARKVSKIEALYHSLRKWVGLRKENLAKHGLVTDGDKIFPSDLYYTSGNLCIDYRSCALCTHYLVKEDKCDNCPLYKVRGVSCDSDNIESRNPFLLFVAKRNPEPMIKLIKDAI